MQIAKWRWPVVLWLHCTGHFRSSRPYSRWLLLLIVPLAYTGLCYSLLWQYNACNKFWRIRLPLLLLEIFCHSCRNRKHKSSLPCSFHSHPNLLQCRALVALETIPCETEEHCRVSANPVEQKAELSLPINIFLILIKSGIQGTVLICNGKNLL